MKKSLLASIVLSALLYTTLLSTTCVIPLVLARYDAGVTIVARDAQAAQPPSGDVKGQRDLRVPPTQPPVLQGPVDTSGPDAQMIKPGKVRPKLIRT